MAVKNKLSDLADHLFMQIERLDSSDLTPEQIDAEHKRSEAMVAVADQILRTSAVQIKAAEMMTNYDGRDPSPYLNMINHGSSSQPRDLVPARKP